MKRSTPGFWNPHSFQEIALGHGSLFGKFETFMFKPLGDIKV